MIYSRVLRQIVMEGTWAGATKNSLGPLQEVSSKSHHEQRRDRWVSLELDRGRSRPWNRYQLVVVSSFHLLRSHKFVCVASRQRIVPPATTKLNKLRRTLRFSVRAEFQAGRDLSRRSVSRFRRERCSLTVRHSLPRLFLVSSSWFISTRVRT